MLSFFGTKQFGACTRHLHRTYATVAEIKTVGVVGMGLMGHGIAQMTATTGYKVVAVDINAAQLEKGVKAIEKSLKKVAAKQVENNSMSLAAADKWLAETQSRITSSGDLKSLGSCDLIIEAIVEDLGIKKKFFAELGSLVAPDAILASNTSSFPITQLGEASGRASQFVGLHLFNPVQVMKLAEVIRTGATTDVVFDTTFRFAKSIGKVPVVCGDTPGFIVNRLLVPFLAQGLLMLDRDDATVQDVDIAMKFGAGMPMGPFTLADYVGLDTCLSILKGWVARHPEEPAFVIPKCLEAKVAAGKLGRKSGEGFWKWEGDKPVAVAP